MKEVRGGNKGPSPRLCPLALTAVGSIGTLEGQGVSNPGYLNTYRFQRSESENGELYNLLKQFWGLEATGITPQVERPLSPKEKLAFDKVNDSTGLTVGGIMLPCLGNMEDQNYRQTDRWQKSTFSQLKRS